MRSPAAAGLFILTLAFGAAAQDVKRGEYVSKARPSAVTPRRKRTPPYAGGRALHRSVPLRSEHHAAQGSGHRRLSEADFVRVMRRPAS
jgi:hypothetical protein